VLRTVAPWADLPRRYPPCHRRFQTRVDDETLERVLRKLAEDLRDRGKLDLREAFSDGSHAGQRRGAHVGKTRRGKATKTALAFLSPWELKVVSEMNRSSSSAR
jgi:hypothetical protein